MTTINCDARRNDFLRVNPIGDSVLFRVVNKTGTLDEDMCEVLFKNREKVEQLHAVLGKWLEANQP